MESAAEVGRRAAERLKASGVRTDVRQLAERMGIEVVVQAAPPPAQPGLRSEYQPSPPRIIVYRQAIAALSAKRRAGGHGESLTCDLEEVHLAHEIFHHLEAEEGLCLRDRGEAEEAAHAFAQELLGLPFDPSELA